MGIRQSSETMAVSTDWGGLHSGSSVAAQSNAREALSGVSLRFLRCLSSSIVQDQMQRLPRAIFVGQTGRNLMRVFIALVANKLSSDS